MPDVYRLELPDGKGVYMVRDDYGYSDALADHLSHHYWPAPYDDGMGMSAWRDLHFGFASIPSMQAWFNGAEHLYLSSFGVILSKYFARGPILAGKKQVAFQREAATLIWQKPLNHF